MQNNPHSWKWRKLVPYRKYNAIISLLILLVVTHAGADPSPKDLSGLWQKAADYMERHHWVPGKIIMQEKTHNPEGKLVEASRFVLELRQDKHRNIRQYLQSAEKNGKDITVEARPTINTHVALEALIGESPFRSRNEQQTTHHFNGRHRTIHGLSCAGFNFYFNADGKTVEGIAWLDEKTGLPAQIQSRITSGPFVEEDIKVLLFVQIDDFTVTEQGQCMLDRTLTKMDVEIPDIKFKGKVNVLSVCKDHWKYVSTP